MQRARRPSWRGRLRRAVSIPVTLTFHFWSGATVTYHVTEPGTSVTGTTS